MKDTEKEVRLNIRVEEAFKERIDAAANNEGINTTAFVKRVLKQYLDQHHPQPPKQELPNA